MQPCSRIPQTIRLSRALAAAVCVALAGTTTPARSQGAFSSEDRARLVAFWNQPGRVQISVSPDASQAGPFKVRLTTEGSRWFLAYQRALGATATPPSQDAQAAAPRQQVWESWVASRLAYDRWVAQTTADTANAALKQPPTAPALPPPAPHPGPIPDDLLSAVGAPPPALARAVTPTQHTIALEDGEGYVFQTHVGVRERYAYYRFAEGTIALGPLLRNLPEEELRTLFESAGFSPSEQRVARAVSRLEGGFESVNTYDTGYISIGFIQFASLEQGRGSLMAVMAREKSERPADFERDFRRYGVDLAPDNTLIVVDPGSGAELQSAQAVLKVIEDKRFAAVFQRAGRHSLAFRVAQIQVAKSRYWPLDDRFSVMLEDGTLLQGKVSDVIRSEAGIATLFDRKVNRGSIGPFAEVLKTMATEKGLKTVDELAAQEHALVKAMKYRADFLADPALSQPTAPPIP